MTWQAQYCSAMRSLRFSDNLEQSILQGIGRATPEDRMCIRRQKRKKYMRWAMTTAACIVILFAVWSIGSLLHGSGNAPGGVPEPSGFTGQRVVIDGRGMGDNGASSCYATPAPGTWFCVPSIKQAMREHAGEDVFYYLEFDLFQNDSPVTEAQTHAELERLAALGYQVGYTKEQYTNGDGAPETFTFAYGYFTQAQIQTFQPNPQYGYFFRFASIEDIAIREVSNAE